MIVVIPLEDLEKFIADGIYSKYGFKLKDEDIMGFVDGYYNQYSKNEEYGIGFSIVKPSGDLLKIAKQMEPKNNEY